MRQITARPCELEEVEAIILALDQKAPLYLTRRSASLPEKMNTTDYVNHMIHRGLLQEFMTADTKLIWIDRLIYVAHMSSCASARTII
ncbi:MAG: hypothetical protein OXC62_13755, partial [Aestuariivita sp.]|nr:hypothetical protein [Aestuariivita sp.]